MFSTRVAIRGATLAVAATIAVPAMAQALPNFPRFFVNGTKLGPVHQPFIEYGSITQLSVNVGSITCKTLSAGNIWNETTEGTEKGLANITQLSIGECKAEVPCKVKNTRGGEVEGEFLTAESPSIIEGTQALPTGISSLPWTGELIEREAGRRQLLNIT